MARVNVYLPDELADEARQAGLNVSGITQAALRAALEAQTSDDWLDRVARLGSTAVTHQDVMAVVDAARNELGGHGAP